MRGAAARRRTDADAAAAAAAELGVHRGTVSQWKNHYPAFIAQLNRTRDGVNAELADRFRVLASSALRVVGEALEGGDSPARTAAAFALLKRVPLTTAVVGPRHADQVVFHEAARRLAVRPRDGEIDLDDEDAPPPMTERFAAAAAAMYAMADTPPADAEKANTLPSAPRVALSG